MASEVGLAQLPHKNVPQVGYIRLAVTSSAMTANWSMRAEDALADGLAGRQFPAFKAHLRKLISVFTGCHSRMPLEQIPEETNVLIPDFRADRLDGRGPVLQQFLGRRYS